MRRKISWWCYVDCRLVDGAPAFRHAIVEGESEFIAYLMGSRVVSGWGDPNGRVSDYAFEIPEVVAAGRAENTIGDKEP